MVSRAIKIRKSNFKIFDLIKFNQNCLKEIESDRRDEHGKNVERKMGEKQGKNRTFLGAESYQLNGNKIDVILGEIILFSFFNYNIMI